MKETILIDLDKCSKFLMKSTCFNKKILVFI